MVASVVLMGFISHFYLKTASDFPSSRAAEDLVLRERAQQLKHLDEMKQYSHHRSCVTLPCTVTIVPNRRGLRDLCVLRVSKSGSVKLIDNADERGTRWNRESIPIAILETVACRVVMFVEGHVCTMFQRYYGSASKQCKMS